MKAGAVKLMADGVIESHTAAMLAPYANKATTGAPYFSPRTISRGWSATLDKDGWQILVHAIGDGAVRMSLDAIEQAAKTNPAPPRGRRHRLEHMETIDPTDIPRFGALGVVASQQPFHGTPSPNRDLRWSANVGDARASRGWATARSRRAAGGWRSAATGRW